MLRYTYQFLIIRSFNQCVLRVAHAVYYLRDYLSLRVRFRPNISGQEGDPFR